MIQTLRLQNFKGIRDVEVGLERLTVFVGPNASGKTSILQGLDFLVNSLDFSRLRTNKYLFLLKDYLCHDPEPNVMELSCRTQVGDVRLRVDSATSFPEFSGGLEILREQWVARPESRNNEPGASWRDWTDLDDVEKSLGYAQLFRFDNELMTKPSAEVAHRLTSDGRWLASTLALMSENQPDNYIRLKQSLKEIIPSIEDVRFEKVVEHKYFARPLEIGDDYKNLIVFDLKGGRNIPAKNASEGTLFILALLAILVNQNRPQLVLIDDLDRGLHPLAQRNVIELLRKVLEQQPDLQIVATTHSPYLVDTLRPEEVRLTTLREDGSVACGRLDEHPDFARWKGEFLPGEMWSMFGEKWVADLAPEVAK